MPTLQEIKERHKNASAPKRVLSRRDIQRETQLNEMTTGNASEKQEPESFLGKARNFATNIIGGGKLAEGLGKSLAAPGVKEQFDANAQRQNDLSLEIINAIQKNKEQGLPTKHLEDALKDSKANLKFIQDQTQDFAESLPSQKQVLGSTARLAATASGGFLASRAGALTGVGKATGIGAKTVRGAGAGVLAGGAEGAIQGAGLVAEKDGSAQEIALGGLAGAGTGAALGGVVGGATGAISGAVSKRKAFVDQRNRLLQQGAPDSRAAQYIRDAQGRITVDPAAQEAIKQGVDEGSVALYKGSSNVDKKAMSKMLDVKLSGLTNKRNALLNRPDGVVGDTVLKRVNALADLNKQAAKKLDDVANGLKGQQVDPTSTAQQFIDDLSDMGVTFKKGSPVFKGSDIEEITPAQNLIKKVTRRMSEVSDDANELHKLKRFIDEQVSYGKASEGLTGNTERIVKTLRSNIDSLLDNNFTQYNQVNTQYSDTIKALDSFGDVAGKTFDLQSPTANENAGNLMRRITSNARSRTDVIDSLSELQETAQKYGKTFDDDIITQVDFLTELERLYGSSAPTSLQGQFENVADQATQGGGLLELGMRATKGAVRSAQDINEESLERSLRELLK